MPYRSMFDNFFSSQRPLFSLSNQIWNPPTDIFDDEQTTVIKMEVAGLDKEEIRIVSEDNVLTIRGQRKHAHRGVKINYQLMEVHYGRFERRFAFPHALKEDAIHASYDRGFLIVEVEKPSLEATAVPVRIIDDNPLD